MKIKKHFTLQNIVGFSICSYGIFPLLPEGLKGFPVVLLLLVSLFVFFKSKSKNFNLSGFIKLSSLYIVSVLSILYTGSFYIPNNKIETSLSLLVIPLAFYLLRSESVKRRHIFLLLKLFVFSTLIMSFSFMYSYFINDLFTQESFKVNSFRNLTTEIPIIGEHPIYVSLFLAISILISLSIYKYLNKKEKVLVFLFLIASTAHLLLLSSKGIIIAIVIAVIVSLFKSVISRITKVAILLSIVGFFIASVLYFPNMERRFRELGTTTTYSHLHTTNSSSIRIAIYKCVVEKIKNKPILGYGWGNGDKALLDCYEKKSNYLLKERFNSHNQYFGYYLFGGIIALSVLVIFLFLQFKLALSNKNNLFLSLLVLFSIQMLTENLLNRQSGIIMFIFFISLFSTLNKVKADSNELGF